MDIRKFFQKGGGAAAKSGEAAGSKRPNAADKKEEEELEPVPKKTKQAAKQETASAKAPAAATKPARKSGPPKPEITITPASKEKPTTAPAKPAAPKPPAGKDKEKPSPAPAKPAAKDKEKPSPVPATSGKGAGSSKGGRGKRSIVIDSDSDFHEEEDGKEDDDSDSDLEVLEDDEVEIAAVKRGNKRGKVEPSAAQPAKEKPSPSPSPGPARRTPAFLKKAAKAPTPEPAPTPAPPPSRSKPAARSGGAKSSAPQLPPDAQAAVALVDAAMKDLPDESGMNVSMGSEFQQGNDNTPPPNHGAKDAPLGHPDCLSGKTFVITGVLDSLYRHDAEDYVKRHGGKVTKSVSGKTTFLVAGSNCGKTKLTEARNKGTKIIDEDHLFKLVAATSHLVDSQPTAPPTAASAGNGSNPMAPSGGAKSGAGTGVKAEAPGAAYGGSAAARSSGAASTSGAAAGDDANNLLWVDKYKPKSSVDLVGNNTLVATLRQWLTRWEDVNLRQAEVQQGKSKSKDMSKKAVLLSGPPGIGKTSSAMIIARECGYEVVEVNASDTRSKHDTKVKEGMNGKMANVVAEMVTSHSICTPDGRQRKQLLVMDEVDGMSGGDRGGVTDLIESIKKTKIPIICICNDKYNMKLRSLRNHTMEMDYRRPTTQQINKRMLEIARSEGLQVNEATMSALVESSNGDLRLILGQLQMIRLRTTALTYDDVKNKMGSGKDADMSPFECARRLLDPASSRLRISDRLELVFMDMDLVPLLVQENYLNHRPVIATNDSERLRCIAKASDAISLGDTGNRMIRMGANWHLAPFTNTVGTVLPAAYMRGGRETFNPHEYNFTRFTAWLGNYSSSTKQRRLLGELTTQATSGGHIQCNRSAVRLEYASALRHLLTAPLKHADTKDHPAIAQVVGLMQDYCINRELMDYILDVTQFKDTKSSWNEDPMKQIPPTIKAAVTRAFNAVGLKAKCGMMVEEAKKGRGGKGRAPAAAPTEELLGTETGEAGEMAPIPEAEEEEEEVLDASALQKDGIVLVAKETGKGKQSGRGRGANSGKAAAGRGNGRASGSGARGSGRATSGRGRGSGRAK